MSNVSNSLSRIGRICASCRRNFFWGESVGKRECVVHPRAASTSQITTGRYRCCGAIAPTAVVSISPSDPTYIRDILRADDGVSTSKITGCHRADHHTSMPGDYQRHDELFVDVDNGPSGMLSYVPGPIMRASLGESDPEAVLRRISDSKTDATTAVHIDDPRMVAIDYGRDRVSIYAAGVEHRCSIRGAFFHLAATYGFSDKPGRLTTDAYTSCLPRIQDAGQVDALISSFITDGMDRDAGGGREIARDFSEHVTGDAFATSPSGHSTDVIDRINNLIQDPTGAHRSSTGAQKAQENPFEVDLRREERAFVDFYMYAWVSPDPQR